MKKSWNEVVFSLMLAGIVSGRIVGIDSVCAQEGNGLKETRAEVTVSAEIVETEVPENAEAVGVMEEVKTSVAVPAPTKTPTQIKKEKAQKKKELNAQKREQQLAQKREQQQAQKREPLLAQKKGEVKEKEKEKEKPKNQTLSFKSDFNGRALTGNLEAAFKTHPEFKALVEEEVVLERQSRALVKKYRAENDVERKKALEAELRTLVERHFTVRQERRLFELKLFEERIATLREEIEARNEKKDRIVEKRLIDLTGSEEDLRF